MTQELVHASVPRDVDGRVGFGVVAVTEQMPPQLIQELSAMSDLASDETNSVGWARHSYVVVSAAGRSHAVVSRVGGCGPDYSGRANRVAHHVVVEPTERTQTSPGVMLRAFPFDESVPTVGRRPVGPSLPRPIALSTDVPPYAAAWGRHLASRLSDSRTVMMVTGFPAGGALAVLQALYSAFGPERAWKIQCSTRPGARFNPNLPMVYAVEGGADEAQIRATHPSAQVVDLAGPPPADAAPAVPKPAVRGGGEPHGRAVVPPAAPPAAPPRPAGPSGPPSRSPIPLSDEPQLGSYPSRPHGHRPMAASSGSRGIEPGLITDIMIVVGGTMLLSAVVILASKAL